MTDVAPPNRTVRRAGLVLLVLAVLALVGAATGWDTQGTAGRVVLVVVAVPLVVVGLVLARTRTPSVAAYRPGADALALDLRDGPTVTVPWADLAGVTVLKQGGAVFAPGYTLRLRYPPGAHPPAALRRFRVASGADGGTVLHLGLKSAQARALASTLPAAAGPRWE